jgi:hypothetical protein
MSYILVDPDRRQHVLATKDAYDAFVKARGLHSRNMRELIGFGTSGREDVQVKEKYNYMLRDNVKWVLLDGTSIAVPLVGSYDYMWKTLVAHHGATCKLTSFKKFINGSRSKLLHEKIKDKPDIFWRLTGEPSAVALLGDGDSLVGFEFEPPQLRIDYATVTLTVPVAPTAPVAPVAPIAPVAPTAPVAPP